MAGFIGVKKSITQIRRISRKNINSLSDREEIELISGTNALKNNINENDSWIFCVLYFSLKHRGLSLLVNYLIHIKNRINMKSNYLTCAS